MKQKIILTIFCFLTILFMFGCQNKAEQKTDNISNPVLDEQLNEMILEHGKTISKPIKGGEFFIFNFEIPANQFVHVQAIQKEIDFKLTLQPAASDSLIIYDTPNGQNGKEDVYFISKDAGNHRIELKPFSDFAEPAGFDIQLKTVRKATDEDRQWMKLYQDMNAANLLRGKRENLNDAVTAFEKLIAQWQKMDDKFQEAVARRSLGYTLRSIGDKDKAITTFQSVLPLWKELGETRYEAFTYLILAGIYKTEHNYDAAIPLTMEAIEKWKEAKDKVQESKAYSDVASFYLMKGETEKSKEYYEMSIASANESGSLSVQGIMLREYGNAWQTFGNDENVLDYYKQALDKYKQMGHPTATALVYRMIGDFLYSKGKRKESKEYFDKALKIYEEINDEQMISSMKEKIKTIST